MADLACNITLSSPLSINIELNGIGTVVPVSTAESDFIVSGPTPFTWLKKTLEEVKTILALTFSNIIADPFRTPIFANPLNLDAASHKDFKCGVITGATTVNLNNASDGDSGVIELIMDGVGGYAVALGAMFTKKLGTASINTAAGKDNFVFWFKNGADIVYTIQTV